MLSSQRVRVIFLGMVFFVGLNSATGAPSGRQRTVTLLSISAYCNAIHRTPAPITVWAMR